MTVKELAKFLRVSPSTVKRMAQKGRLPPPIHVEKQLRYMPDEVLTHLRNKPSK